MEIGHPGPPGRNVLRHVTLGNVYDQELAQILFPKMAETIATANAPRRFTVIQEIAPVIRHLA